MQIQTYEGSRPTLLPLFRLADESESQVLSYYETGDVFVACDGNLVVGMAHVVKDDMTIEIVSLAVIPERQGQGIGGRLIEEAINYCRLNQISRLVVRTGSWETEQYRFLSQTGLSHLQRSAGLLHARKWLCEVTSRSSPIRNEPMSLANTRTGTLDCCSARSICT